VANKTLMFCAMKSVSIPHGSLAITAVSIVTNIYQQQTKEQTEYDSQIKLQSSTTNF